MRFEYTMFLCDQNEFNEYFPVEQLLGKLREDDTLVCTDKQPTTGYGNIYRTKHVLKHIVNNQCNTPFDIMLCINKP